MSTSKINIDLVVKLSVEVADPMPVTPDQGYLLGISDGSDLKNTIGEKSLNTLMTALENAGFNLESGNHKVVFLQGWVDPVEVGK